MSSTPVITPSTAEMIVSAIESRLAELHTGLPAKVISFNSNDGVCDVQVLLLRVALDEDGNEVEITIPPITNVPVHYLGGGGWSLIFPLAKDDIVFLAFMERSIDAWMEADAGKIVDPVDTRKHDLSDAIAIPQLRPRTSPIKDLAGLGENLRLGYEGGAPAIVMKPDGTMEFGEGATEALVLGDKLKSELTTIRTFQETHMHPTSSPGAPTGPAAIPPLPLGEFLSPKGRVL